MIDHLLGRPNPAWKRTQVFIVTFFWVWRIVKGNRNGPKGFFGIPRYLNRLLSRYSPYQIITSTLTLLYIIRHIDAIIGLGSPEPLARMYSPSYYRATWIVTALDAGFATAMTIRPKWLRDLASVIFSGYYIIYANEADEKLRKFRAVITVDMLRVTWEKAMNPYIRIFTRYHRPSLPYVRHLLLPRPHSSKYTEPIGAMLFYPKPESQLSGETEVVLDFPGGGFISMGPEHHEERLRKWAKTTGRAVLSIDYGKSPEYPFPWPIDEGFDAYLTLIQTKGKAIGFGGSQDIGVILSGDSAGANICMTIVIKILENPTPIPKPLALVFAYGALDFNFTSWMSPANLEVLKAEQSSSHIPGMLDAKDHGRHRSPLSVVPDLNLEARKRKPGRMERSQSWGRSLSKKLPSFIGGVADLEKDSPDEIADSLSEEDLVPSDDNEKSIDERIRTPTSEMDLETQQLQLSEAVDEARIRAKRMKRAPIGTRLTMTSRTGFFQDRIIPPSMMRAMAILYVGPKQSPNFETDYYLSPLLAPSALLSEFPPVLMFCGEKDPFIDDTIILAGRIREAKRIKRARVLQVSTSRSAKFGEGLRMSSGPSTPGSSAKVGTDPIILEDEEDWVQVRIIEGFGHGFMQMSSLIPEVESILTQMSTWMKAVFDQALEPAGNVGRQKKGMHQRGRSFGQGDEDELLTFQTRPKKCPPPPDVQPSSSALKSNSPTEGDGKPQPHHHVSISSTLATPILSGTPSPIGSPAPHVPVPALIVNNDTSSSSILRPDFYESPRSSQDSGPQVHQSRIINATATSPASAPMELAGSSNSSEGKVKSPLPSPTSLALTPNPNRPITNLINAALSRTPTPTGSVVTKLDEAELMRRRRMDAVFGLGETRSAVGSDADESSDDMKKLEFNKSKGRRGSSTSRNDQTK